MTRAEMTEIFAILALAYPNAEMFKAPNAQAIREKLAPTIVLWTACLQEFDSWTMQRAVVQVCQTCKFPPSIAEMREAGETVLSECKAEISNAYLVAKNALAIGKALGETKEQICEALPPRVRRVIAEMGGIEKFAPTDKPWLDMCGFEHTYERLLRSAPIELPGHPALAAITKKEPPPSDGRRPLPSNGR